MGVASGVHGLRSRWLLRFITREARHTTFPKYPASGDAFGHAWRSMDLVLCTRGRRQAHPRPTRNQIKIVAYGIARI